MKLKQAIKELVEMKSAKLQINKNVDLTRFAGKTILGDEVDNLSVNVRYNGYREISTQIQARTADGIMEEVKKAVASYLQWMQEKELKTLKQYTWAEKYQGIEELYGGNEK